MKAIFMVGDEDFSDIVAAGGIKWSRNDIDSAKTSRSKLDAKMHRKRLAIKRKLSVSCMRMGVDRMKALNAAIMPETVSVTFLDPIAGEHITRTFYGSTVEATTQITVGDDVYWDGTSFNLIEV